MYGIVASDFDNIILNNENINDDDIYSPTEKEIKLFEKNGDIIFNKLGSDKDLYIDMFYEAYYDCKAMGIPIENGGPICVVSGTPIDKDDPSAAMYTLYVELNGKRYYKISCIKRNLNEQMDSFGDEILQMYFAHELIHTACYDDRHGDTFNKYVKKLIKYGNKKYGGYEENPYNEMDMTYGLNQD